MTDHDAPPTELGAHREPLNRRDSRPQRGSSPVGRHAERPVTRLFLALLQAVIVAVLVVLGLSFEEAWRDRLGLVVTAPAPTGAAPTPAGATELSALHTQLERIELALAESGEVPGTSVLADTLDDLASRQVTMTSNLAALRQDVAALQNAMELRGLDGGDAPAAPLETRLRVLERLVTRVESKVDDLRDTQLFPVATPSLEEDAQ